MAADLDKLGLEVVSFTIKDVNDDSRIYPEHEPADHRSE